MSIIQIVLAAEEHIRQCLAARRGAVALAAIPVSAALRPGAPLPVDASALLAFANSSGNPPDVRNPVKPRS